MAHPLRFGIWAAVHGSRAAHHDPDEPDDATWARNRALVLEAEALGYDAVLLNTAIAKAADPVAMAGAFRRAVEAGRAGYEAGLMQSRDFASPSTPVIGTPFWHAAP